METDAKRQRQQFYRDYVSGQWSMSELCARYQISRPTGYKWVGRIERDGLKSVGDRSRAPRTHPNQTPEPIERALLAVRDRYGWGASKLLKVLEREHPNWKLPSRFTANKILDRHGKLRKNRRRRRWKHPGALRLETAGPNEIWPADFKGQFKTRDGKYCYPLSAPLRPVLPQQRTQRRRDRSRGSRRCHLEHRLLQHLLGRIDLKTGRITGNDKP